MRIVRLSGTTLLKSKQNATCEKILVFQITTKNDTDKSKYTYTQFY